MSTDYALADIAVEIERQRQLLIDLQERVIDLIQDEVLKETAWLRVYTEDGNVD